MMLLINVSMEGFDEDLKKIVNRSKDPIFDFVNYIYILVHRCS